VEFRISLCWFNKKDSSVSALSPAFFNSPEQIRQLIQAQRITWGWPLFMLICRTLLFAGIQALVAIVLLIGGSRTPWLASVAWWPIVPVYANVVTLLLLSRLFRAEGSQLTSLYKIQRGEVGKDLLIIFGLLVVAGPVALLPNILVARWLYGGSEVVGSIFFQRMPLSAAIFSLLLFPLTNALAELPTYMSYSMPRIAALSQRGWLAVLLAGFFLAFQHVALPLFFDWRFMTWRLLMFIPFALLTAALLYWRPRLLPYMLIIHLLMDLQLAFSVLMT
jgi:hypothetical protein